MSFLILVFYFSHEFCYYKASGKQNFPDHDFQRERMNEHFQFIVYISNETIFQTTFHIPNVPHSKLEMFHIPNHIAFLL